MLRLLALALIALFVGGATRADFAREEVRRIQRHLAGAEALCQSRDSSKLTPRQRRARATHLKRLAAYRRRGVFPKNEVQPGRTPVFRDRFGTLCAMGYLLAESGRGDLVEKIATTRNLATIHQLSDDPALVKWLQENGLTLEEAARIQPTYSFGPNTLDQSLRVASVLGTTLGVVQPRSRFAGYFGVAAGLTTLVRGVDVSKTTGPTFVRGVGYVDSHASRRRYAQNSMLYGAASTYLGLRALKASKERREVLTMTPTENGGARLAWTKAL